MQYLLLTHPRSASHLFCRMLLLSQDNVTHTQYSFGLEMLDVINDIRKASLETLPAEQREKMYATYKDSIDLLEKSLKHETAEGKILTDKEHPSFMIRPEFQQQPDDQKAEPRSSMPPEYFDRQQTRPTSNITVVPDELLLSVRPIFLIRHPAFAIPSMAKILTKVSAASLSGSSMLWPRLLLDWYDANVSDESKKPIIVDATRFMTSLVVRQKLCTMTGLDPEQIQTKWALPTDKEREEMLPIDVRMMGTLTNSEGVVAEKAREKIDVDEEAARWHKDFSAAVAQRVEAMVRHELANYNYMLSRSLTSEEDSQ